MMPLSYIVEAGKGEAAVMGYLREGQLIPPGAPRQRRNAARGTGGKGDRAGGVPAHDPSISLQLDMMRLLIAYNCLPGLLFRRRPDERAG